MNLDHLKTLSNLKYLHSQQALSELLRRENDIRSELARLRTLLHETQAQPPEQVKMRTIGGDVIWMQWLGQAQRKLNIELAQILAQKETLLAKHNKAHGRKIVAERLADQEITLCRRMKLKAQIENAVAHSLLR